MELPELRIDPKVERLAISFSGGETSAFMTKMLLDKYRGKLPIVVTFANTGQEREETLEFVRDCDREFDFQTVWVEAVTNPQNGKGATAKVVSFETASRNGEPFEQLIAKSGIPNLSYPHCSDRLKAIPLMDFYKKHFKASYYTAIGIRADEFDRASPKAIENRLIYPLVMAGVQKPDINRFWSQKAFRLNLKSYQGNCKWCWKKSYRKLLTIAAETPEAFDFPLRMEAKYGNFKKDTQGRPLPITFFRENRSTLDILESAAAGGFIPVGDESVNTTAIVQGTLFATFMDESAGCESSCEAF